MSTLDIRAEILASVRSNQPAARDVPGVPTFHRAPESLVAAFERSLTYMAGTFVAQPPPDVAAFLRDTFPQARNICSLVPEYTGNKGADEYSNWADAAEIDVTVVRSPLGVAETGSVLLSDEDLRVNTLGFLAHDLVVLLDPQAIVENIHDAYQHRAFRARPYAVLMTGPSGSADIEGTTVHPAQGVMTLTVIMWPVGQPGQTA